MPRRDVEGMPPDSVSLGGTRLVTILLRIYCLQNASVSNLAEIYFTAANLYVVLLKPHICKIWKSGVRKSGGAYYYLNFTVRFCIA